MSSPASARYELCEPVNPHRWGLKAFASIVIGVATQTDPWYSGGLRWRIRDRETGEYVYEITTSLGGLDAQEARSSVARHLASMSVEEFERESALTGGWDR